MLLGIVRDEKNSFAVTNRTVFFQKQWSDPPTGFLNFGTEQRQPLKIYKNIFQFSTKTGQGMRKSSVEEDQRISDRLKEEK